MDGRSSGYQRRAPRGGDVAARLCLNVEVRWMDVEVRWMDIDTEARLDGVSIGKVRVDPWVFGLGLGFRLRRQALRGTATATVRFQQGGVA